MQKKSADADTEKKLVYFFAYMLVCFLCKSRPAGFISKH